MRKSCNGCIHYRRYSLIGMGCHYILDTGEQRRCDPAECDKYEAAGYITTVYEDGSVKLRFVRGSGK